MTCLILTGIAGPCKACGEPLGEDVHCVCTGPGKYSPFHQSCCPAQFHESRKRRKEPAS